MAVELGAFLVDFAIAAAVGGLIGVEREHRARDPASGQPEGVVIAGVRTFPLVAIAGFLVAFLARDAAAPIVLAAGVVGAFGTAFVFSFMRHRLGMSGMTTPLAMIVTFLLGGVIGYGYRFEGVVIGVVVTFLLVTKKRLHQFVLVLDDDEILSALQFITVLFILLPLTADLAPGWLGQSWLGRATPERPTIVDPFVILLTVVFVSAISFVSLLVMRQFGPRRGMEFSGLIGGLVNSEATTVSLAQRAAEDPALLAPAVVGALLASSTMVLRNLAIAAFADPSLSLVSALLPFTVPVALVGALLAWRARVGVVVSEPSAAVRVKNPFAVLPALRFAAVFAAVSIVVTLAQARFGAAGVYVAAIGGLVSAGPVIASIGALVVKGTVPLSLALRAATLAVAASLVNKLIILRTTNRAAFDRASTSFTIMTAAALAAVLASFFV